MTKRRRAPKRRRVSRKSRRVEKDPVSEHVSNVLIALAIVTLALLVSIIGGNHE